MCYEMFQDRVVCRFQMYQIWFLIVILIKIYIKCVMNKLIKFVGIIIVSQRYIFIVDSLIYFIYILDQNEQFFCFIENCDLKFCFDLCVDSNNSLFVCEYYKGSVKKIKY